MTSSAVVLVLLAASSEGASALAKAELLMQDLRYVQAEPVVEAAFRAEGLSRNDYIKVLEFRGVCASMLKKLARAKETFKILAAVDPQHELPAQYGPRARTPFREAKAWVAEHGDLRLDAVPTAARDTLLLSLQNPLGIASTVRIEWRVHGAPEVKRQEFTLATHQAKFSDRLEVRVLDGQHIEWWGSVFNHRGSALLNVGASSDPRTLNAPSPVQLLSDQNPMNPLALRPEGGVAGQPAIRYRPTLRWVAYSATGLAAVSAGAGAWFGYRSKASARALEEIQYDASGRIVSTTQREAFAIVQQSRSDATRANVLFISSAVLALAGVGFMIGDIVARPAAGGLVVSGPFK